MVPSNIETSTRKTGEHLIRQPHHIRQHGSSLGLKARSTAELVDQVERGFSFQALESFESTSGIGIPLVASIIGIPTRTLARRKSRDRMTLEESERLLRIATVFEQAVALFEGDVAAAVDWLLRPRQALAGHSPLAYSRTELGARQVENLIGRLEHGVFS